MYNDSTAEDDKALPKIRAPSSLNNSGFLSISMGPSNLLKKSGSSSDIPKMGEYHTNLKKHLKYNPVGPG